MVGPLKNCARSYPEESKRLLRIMVQAILAGADATWRMRCNLAAGWGKAKVAVSRKMKQQAKFLCDHAADKRTHVAYLLEATVTQILSRPDSQIETWIHTNDDLLCKVKEDTGQRNIREFFATGCIVQ